MFPFFICPTNVNLFVFIFFWKHLMINCCKDTESVSHLPSIGCFFLWIKLIFRHFYVFV